MGISEYEWRIQHKLGDTNRFSEYFQAQNFSWRLAAISTDRHYIFLEHFGYLTFDVFADYHLNITYADGEKEKKSITFSFGSQLDFGTQIQEKETECVTVNIISAVRCYESKKTTPYAGMINLGSTCYLNSLLQTLFHIKGFVHEIFKQEPKGKTLEMQKLFYQLEKEKNYVDTVSFANAFKLNDPIDDQQDIQEFFNVLLDTLEKEAKDTPFFQYIEDTFYGRLGTLIECEEGCRSEKVEKYNDIQLVMGTPCRDNMNTSLEDALQAHITITQLEEPNLYRCEKHGYVRATKKDYFKTFSPILFFQIKRFNIDYDMREVYKINDYFSFPTELDLSPFMLDQKEKNRYILYSVNVHLGDGISEGHYYAYIKKQNKWYKFNDCYVTLSSEQEAVNGTFGGMHPYKNKQNIANAYYLVYVKETEKERLLGEPAENEPPLLIKNIIDKDNFLSQTAEINLCTKETAKGYWGPGPFSASPCYLREPLAIFKAEKSNSITQLRSMVKQSMQLGSTLAEDILLYNFSDENNGTISPIENTSIVGDLSSNLVFAIKREKEIPEEDLFVLFVKTEKAVDQPYNLKFAVEVKSVHLLSKKENILEWTKKHHTSQTPLLAEKNGSVEEIDELSTFSDCFNACFGTILVNAGIDSVKEYFAEILTHKILIGYSDSIPFFSLWVEKDASEESVCKEIEKKLQSKKFKVKNISKEKDSVEIKIDEGYAIVQIAVLNDRTENINLLKKEPRIVPLSFSGTQLLSILQIDSNNLRSKTKVIRTYAGDRNICLFTMTQSVSVKNGALLVLQKVSSKKYAEAFIRYNNEILGHPFFIDLQRKRSAMEIKRRYKIDHGIVMRISNKRHSIIDDDLTVKKSSSSDVFAFEINYQMQRKIMIQRTYHIF